MNGEVAHIIETSDTEIEKKTKDVISMSTETKQFLYIHEKVIPITNYLIQQQLNIAVHRECDRELAFSSLSPWRFQLQDSSAKEDQLNFYLHFL